MPNSNIFDESYAGGEATEAAKPEKSQTKQFLKDPLPSSDAKKYGISKPRRIVIRGRIAKW